MLWNNNHELCVYKDLEGNSRDVFQGTVPVVWRKWEKTWRHSGLPINRPEYKSTALNRIHVEFMLLLNIADQTSSCITDRSTNVQARNVHNKYW